MPVKDLKWLLAATPRPETADDPENLLWTMLESGKVVDLGTASRAVALGSLDDLGNANRLATTFGDRIRYSYEMRKWLVWDGSRWQVDRAGQIVETAKTAALSILVEAGREPDKERRGRLIRHAERSCSKSSIAAMTALTETKPKIRLAIADLDSDQFLLNTPSGTVDLRTSEMRPHRKADLLTKITTARYDPAAACPLVDAVLDRAFAGDQEMVQYFWRAVGYSLTGSNREQVTFFCYGRGHNGKSTVLSTIVKAMGDYARGTKATTIAEHREQTGPDPEIVALVGSRFVSVQEWEESTRLNEGRVKSLTGGDPITARTLHAEPFTFWPTFKCWLATNHKPTIVGTDDGIWRRIRLIPWLVNVPDAEQDKTLPDKLLCEMDGILTRAIRGAAEWYRDGLCEPQTVLTAGSDYRLTMDALADCLDSAFVVGPHCEVGTTVLYQVYTRWAEENGQRPMSQMKLAEKLKERGLTKRRTEAGAVWEGIGLRSMPGQVGPPTGGAPRPVPIFQAA
jgi:putative DNA primase/helicase